MVYIPPQADKTIPLAELDEIINGLYCHLRFKQSQYEEGPA